MRPDAFVTLCEFPTYQPLIAADVYGIQKINQIDYTKLYNIGSIVNLHEL